MGGLLGHATRLAALALAAPASSMAASAPSAAALAAYDWAAPSPSKRHKRVQRVGGGVVRKYRNKRFAGRPRKHRNRLHVSARVRRRHRRAKRGK